MTRSRPAGAPGPHATARGPRCKRSHGPACLRYVPHAATTRERAHRARRRRAGRQRASPSPPPARNWIAATVVVRTDPVRRPGRNTRPRLHKERRRAAVQVSGRRRFHSDGPSACAVSKRRRRFRLTGGIFRRETPCEVPANLQSSAHALPCAITRKHSCAHGEAAVRARARTNNSAFVLSNARRSQLHQPPPPPPAAARHSRETPAQVHRRPSVC